MALHARAAREGFDFAPKGLAGVRDPSRLRHPLDAIRGLYEELLTVPDIELLHEPDTGVLCCRLVPHQMSAEELDRLQKHINRTIPKKGNASFRWPALERKRRSVR